MKTQSRKMKKIGRRDEGRRGAIFLDRDGVINYERQDYVKNLDEFRFIDGAVKGVRLLSSTGLPVIVVTNQSAVGRGLLSQSTLNLIHTHMLAVVRAHGGRIASVYFCPHRPDEGCNCRKPRTDLFRMATERFNLDLKQSWLVGDKPSDEQAAVATGCKMVRVRSNTPFALLHASEKIIRSQDWPQAGRIAAGQGSRLTRPQVPTREVDSRARKS